MIIAVLAARLAALIKYAATVHAHALKLAQRFAAAFAFRISVPTMTIAEAADTLAETIRKEIDAEIISGRDYLRMAKAESEAGPVESKMNESRCGNKQ